MFSGPGAHPCSDIGRLQSDINRIDRDLSRKVDAYEMSTINSNVASMECAIEEIRSLYDGFCFKLETFETNQEETNQEIIELKELLSKG